MGSARHVEVVVFARRCIFHCKKASWILSSFVGVSFSSVSRNVIAPIYRKVILLVLGRLLHGWSLLDSMWWSGLLWVPVALSMSLGIC